MRIVTIIKIERRLLSKKAATIRIETINPVKILRRNSLPTNTRKREQARYMKG
jgi:hypothetical protein